MPGARSAAPDRRDRIRAEQNIPTKLRECISVIDRDAGKGRLFRVGELEQRTCCRREPGPVCCRPAKIVAFPHLEHCIHSFESAVRTVQIPRRAIECETLRIAKPPCPERTLGDRIIARDRTVRIDTQDLPPHGPFAGSVLYPRALRPVVTYPDVQFPVGSESENASIVLSRVVHPRDDEDLRRMDPRPCGIQVAFHDAKPVHGADIVDEDEGSIGIRRMECDPEQSLFSFIVHGNGEERFGSQRAVEQAYPSAVLLGEEEFSAFSLNGRDARWILSIRCARERIDPVLQLRERRCCEDEDKEEE